MIQNITNPINQEMLVEIFIVINIPLKMNIDVDNKGYPNLKHHPY